MTRLAIFLIRFYQKWISPHKGFRCAHAALHGGNSCSEEIKNIIEAYGIFSSFTMVRTRFADCKLASIELYTQKKDDNKKKDKTKWYDCCDPSAACDAASCMSRKSCDLPDLSCDCSLF